MVILGILLSQTQSREIVLMKEFMLLIRNEIDHNANWPAEQEEEFSRKCQVYIENLTSKGKLRSAQPLVREGVMLSAPGGQWREAQFNEAKEIIVGYYHILADSMNEAVTIAKGNPEFLYGSTARIEVRPIKTEEESTEFVYPE